MKRMLGIALAAVLAACGGGDGDSAPPTLAEGLWQGRTSTGLNANVAVLENGELWGVYGANSVIFGAIHGRSRTDGTDVSGSGATFDVTGRAVRPTSFSGTVAPGTSIAVSTPEGVRFTAVYHPGYDQAPSLADFAGTFRGQAVSPNSAARLVSFSVSARGEVAVAEPGCLGTGSVRPRPSGKNIHDLQITFVGSACVLGDGTTVSGVAYYDRGTRQLLAMALNGERSDGFIYLGVK